MQRLGVRFMWIPLVMLALAPACGSSQTAGDEVEPGVVFLGERKVAFVADRDVIPVGAVDGRFKALRIHVLKSPMEMYDIKVTFGNGKVWSPPTRLVFRRGEWTRRIDLPGGKRVIRKVAFLYRSKQLKSGKAHVRVFGVR